MYFIIHACLSYTDWKTLLLCVCINNIVCRQIQAILSHSLLGMSKSSVHLYIWSLYSWLLRFWSDQTGIEITYLMPLYGLNYTLFENLWETKWIALDLAILHALLVCIETDVAMSGIKWAVIHGSSPSNHYVKHPFTSLLVKKRPLYCLWNAETFRKDVMQYVRFVGCWYLICLVELCGMRRCWIFYI